MITGGAGTPRGCGCVCRGCGSRRGLRRLTGAQSGNDCRITSRRAQNIDANRGPPPVLDDPDPPGGDVSPPDRSRCAACALAVGALRRGAARPDLHRCAPTRIGASGGRRTGRPGAGDVVRLDVQRRAARGAGRRRDGRVARGVVADAAQHQPRMDRARRREPLDNRATASRSIAPRTGCACSTTARW